MDEGIPSYLHKLTQAPLLTPEEEVTLTRAARQGDEASRNRLIESNMRLVINIARSYRSRAVPLEDLIQEGALGLAQAIERFDPDKGFRFSTYATHWIRQSIGRAIDNKSRSIRLPAHISQTVRKISRAKAKIQLEEGDEPTAERLADELGMTDKRLFGILQASKDLLSLDMKVGDAESATLGSLIKDEGAHDPERLVIDAELLEELHEVMMELNERERKILSYRLRVNEVDGGSFRDKLSEEMQLSRERIRQIEVRAIKKLRTVAQRRRIRDLLNP